MKPYLIALLLSVAATSANAVVGYKLQTDAESPGGAVWLAGPGSPADGASQRNCAFFYDADRSVVPKHDLAQFLRIVNGAQYKCTIEKGDESLKVTSVLQSDVSFVLTEGPGEKCEWYVVTMGKPLAPSQCLPLPVKK